MSIEHVRYECPNPEDLIFGQAAYPVTCGHSLTIGDGAVYPEMNFTLPEMLVNDTTRQDVVDQYSWMIDSVLSRARKLSIPGLVIEFEQLPAMTEIPELGAEITGLLKTELDTFYKETCIPNALRVTVVDLRDSDERPMMRDGIGWETTVRALEFSAQEGADILSIESIGGKEVHDQALLYGDLPGIVSSLGVLGFRDVIWLWEHIVELSHKYKCIPGGDSACGFANTAMQLAGQGLLPSTLAALDRVASAPRTYAAYLSGAMGPSKDCAYEGPIIKALTGTPISMEGRSSCCAHFSPLGNIAGACADLWSNESVQNVQLLSGSAPEAFMELLAYDCRMFNTAIRLNPANYRQILIDSDVHSSPEALMLAPETAIQVASKIQSCQDGYAMTLCALNTGFDIIKDHLSILKDQMSKTELEWIHRADKLLESLPPNEAEAIGYLDTHYSDQFRPDSYGL